MGSVKFTRKKRLVTAARICMIVKF